MITCRVFHLNKFQNHFINRVKLNHFNKFNLIQCTQFCPINRRCIYESKLLQMPIKTQNPYDFNDDWMSKIWRKFGIRGIPKHRIAVSSIYMYESCTDGIDVEKFFNYCQLPDTFLSWFLVTELHIWMCMVRAMLEGKEGRTLRNCVVERLWEDIDSRLKNLARISMKQKKEGLDMLSSHLRAALIGYDEGLHSDKVLAASLWRNLFIFKEVDPIILEHLVKYIRAQLEHLTEIERDEFLIDGRVQWKEFPFLYP